MADFTVAAHIDAFMIGANTGVSRTAIMAQLQDQALDDISGLAVDDGNMIVGDGVNWVAESGATLRTTIGIGGLGVKDTVNNDDWLGTDLAVINGGTGASTDTQARINLGVEIGVDVQAFDQQLLDIAAMTPTDSNFIVGNGSTFVLEDPATARISLGIVIGTNVQAQGDVLDDLNTLGANAADNEFLVGTGAGALAWESGDTVRTSLGLAIGIDVQAHGDVLDDLNTLGVNAADNEFLVGTGAGALAWEDAATARISMGITIGTNVQAHGDVLDDLNTLGANAADNEFLVGTGPGALAWESGDTVRTSLGLAIGTDVQAHGDVLDDLNTLGVNAADNEFLVGTAAGALAWEDAATARTSMGVAIGTNVQAHGDVLDDLNTLGANAADNEFLVGTGAGALAWENAATARTSMGAQTQGDVLDDLNTLGANAADSEFLVGTGAGALAWESGATARTSLGLGTIAVLDAPAGDVVGTTDTQTLTNKTINFAANTITGLPIQLMVSITDETTDITTGNNKVTFRMPYAMTLTEVRANVNTAPTGSVITVDINESGGTVLSTKLTIDVSEKTSETALNPPIISDSALADDAEMTIDIDTIGSTVPGKGLKVTFIGTRT